MAFLRLPQRQGVVPKVGEHEFKQNHQLAQMRQVVEVRTIDNNLSVEKPRNGRHATFDGKSRLRRETQLNYEESHLLESVGTAVPTETVVPNYQRFLASCLNCPLVDAWGRFFATSFDSFSNYHLLGKALILAEGVGTNWFHETA